jgi:single-strand DNA-binding protein
MKKLSFFCHPSVIPEGKEIKMNHVVLMGRLTRDPDVRYTQGENSMAVARYTLAVDRRTKKEGAQQTADFISCVAFDRAAEFAQRYLFKGTRVLIGGHIQTGSYTNRDGNKVYTTDVVIESQEFTESKNNADQSGAAASASNQGKPIGDGFMEVPDDIDDEGLPFN